jgi:hypothetical protein
VLSPSMLPANNRGLTTQKIDVSLSRGSACRVVSITTDTRVWSGVRSRLFTVPRIMSLNLSCDWPACSPSALSKDKVIVGPRLDNVSQASQAPIATASKGISHMGEIREERRIDARAIFGGSVVSLKAITSFLWHEARLVVRSPVSGAATMPTYRAPETLEPYRQPASRSPAGFPQLSRNSG